MSKFRIKLDAAILCNELKKGLKYYDNKPTTDDWNIPCSSHYLVWYTGMKYCKLGTVVTFSEAKIHGHGGTSYRQKEGIVTLITPNGVNVNSEGDQIFIKWQNVIGLYS